MLARVSQRRAAPLPCYGPAGPVPIERTRAAPTPRTSAGLVITRAYDGRVPADLAATTRTRLPELGRTFAAAKPFRHVVIDDFLEPAFCARLAAEFPPFNPELARNELGTIGRKCVHTQVRTLRDAYRELDDFLQTRDFLGAIERITAIPDLRYDPDYYGGGTHENLSGQGLHAHVDYNLHPRTGQHRRLNLILYLDDGWQPAWGGCIQLHSNPWEPETNQVLTIPPVRNRCVLFETTESSWHGFEPIAEVAGRTLSRRSFAIYLYTDTRPAHEIAPAHATFYVHPPLPARYSEGRTLSAADCTELRALLRGRDDWIRALYEREKQFNAEIARLRYKLARSPSRRIAALLAPPHSRRRQWLERWLARGS